MRYVFEGISFDHSHLELEVKPSPLGLIWHNPRLMIALIVVLMLYPVYLCIRIQRNIKHWWVLSGISNRIEAAYWRIDFALDSVANTVRLFWIGLAIALISPLLELTGVACA